MRGAFQSQSLTLELLASGAFNGCCRDVDNEAVLVEGVATVILAPTTAAEEPAEEVPDSFLMVMAEMDFDVTRPDEGFEPGEAGVAAPTPTPTPGMDRSLRPGEVICGGLDEGLTEPDGITECE